VSQIDSEDVPRFGALGVIASMQPRHAIGGLMTWSRSVGPDRAPFGWATRSLSAAGAHLAFGSDWPKLPLDPLAGVRAAVARPELHAPEQLTLKSAINAWTSGSRGPRSTSTARARVKPDMLADIVNPLDRHLRRSREAPGGRSRHDDLSTARSSTAAVVKTTGVKHTFDLRLTLSDP